MSQTSIAHATGQNQSEVSEIVAGRQVQSVALLERIADGLGVPRGWMGLAYAADTEPVQTEQQDPETKDDSHANLFRHAGKVLWNKPIFGLAEPIRVKHTPTPVPRRVGPVDVEQVTTITRRLDQFAGDLGGIPMTNALTAHARASEALLGAIMQEPTRKQLLVALSDVHQDAGFAAAGAGLRELAREHHVRSMDHAGEAGDPLRAAFALDSLGRLEFDVGQPNEALKLFQLGAAAARSPLARSRLEFDCAYALGLLGVTEEALAVLRRARDSHHAARDEPRPWEHVATAASYIEGCTYFALGRFDQATRALSVATQGMGHAMTCAVHNSGLLAAAQLRGGELRSGLQTAERVIGLARRLRSAPARDGLGPLHEAAAARRDSACQDLAREVAMLRSAA